MISSKNLIKIFYKGNTWFWKKVLKQGKSVSSITVYPHIFLKLFFPLAFEMLHEVLSPALWLLLCLLFYLLFVWLSFPLASSLPSWTWIFPIFLYVHIYLHINIFNYDLHVNNHQSLDCLQNSKPMFSSVAQAFLCDSTMSTSDLASLKQLSLFFPPPLSFPLPPSWIYFFYYWYQ